MSEKTTLLPTAPVDFVAPEAPPQAERVEIPRIMIIPGLEFDPTRRYRYGTHALSAALLLFVSFVLIEMRDCNFGPGIDLNRLQALHLGIMIFAFVLYLMSLFGIADFIFQYKIFFFAGAIIVYIFAGLMVWTTYEAAVNPCVKTFNIAPVDLSHYSNVFSRGDAVGIIVVLLDGFATLLIVSAASNFYRRY